MEGGVMARIVFDLDGTLIDSAPDIHGIANVILAEESAAPIDLATARDFIGNGARVFVQRMRAARGIPDSEQDRIFARFTALYDTAVTLTVPYDGVLQALEALKAAGHRLGICTNKPIRPTKIVLKEVGLIDVFDCIYGGDSLPVHKPDPAPLNSAFADLGAGDEIYVGDSEVDAETAQRAHVPFVLFAHGYRKSELAQIPHSRVLNRFADLPAMVAEMLSEDA
jgi:phosphoglycolate phosphatase